VIRDRVHRLRTVAAPGRAAQARLHGEQRLADLDSAKLGFGQSAIVCAKHLRLQGAWPDLRSQAHRPALETSALDHAPVVWFQDGAELLSCLARDAGTDRLDRWWWHLLLGSAPTPDRVADRFTDDPASARAALERIGSTPILGQFLSYLGRDRAAAIERATSTRLLSPPSTDSVQASRTPPTEGSTSFGIPVSTFDPSVASELQDPAIVESKAPAQAFPSRTNPVDSGSPGAKPDPGPTRPGALEPSTKYTTESVTPREAGVFPPPKPGPRDFAPPFAPKPVATPAWQEANSNQPKIVLPLDGRIPSDRMSDSVEATAPTNLADPTPETTPAPFATNYVESTEPESAPGPRHGLERSLASPDPIALKTEFGGLLFVLDALLALEWIPDFTRPLDRGIGVAPLEYLLRLGRHRFGKRFAKDALHGWMAGQIEPDHAMGPPPRLDELEARIAVSMGLRPRRAMHRLCHRPARMRISSGRVDVDFRLAEHPLEIRMAGLDRDPGWIPTAGWDFRFHFAAEGA